MKFNFKELNNKKIKVTLVDTAGQERFGAVTANFYRGAHCILFCYDCTVEQTFKKVENWFRKVNEQASTDIMKVLVANKIDLEDQRVISRDDGQSIAKKYDMKYYEVSALSGFGVVEMYDELVTILSQQKQKLEDSNNNREPSTRDTLDPNTQISQTQTNS